MLSKGLCLLKQNITTDQFYQSEEQQQLIGQILWRHTLYLTTLNTTDLCTVTLYTHKEHTYPYPTCSHSDSWERKKTPQRAETRQTTCHLLGPVTVTGLEFHIWNLCFKVCCWSRSQLINAFIPWETLEQKMFKTHLGNEKKHFQKFRLWWCCAAIYWWLHVLSHLK